MTAEDSPRHPRILVSGLRSTGKSRLVAALWGDTDSMILEEDEL